MSPSPPRAPRRRDGLSRDRIVEAAIVILDADGEQALTVRNLTEHLTTGRGAIYHHVSGMDDLLATAADDVLAAVLTEATGDPDPTSVLRRLAVGIFDAVDRHPWVGTQLARDPVQPAVLRIWKAIAVALRAGGVTGSAAADAGSALTSFVFGSTAHVAARARSSRDPAARQNHLDALASQWTADDPDPVVREVASHLRGHDDRRQFLAGVDIVLRGITTPPRRSGDEPSARQPRRHDGSGPRSLSAPDRSAGAARSSPRQGRRG